MNPHRRRAARHTAAHFVHASRRFASDLRAELTGSAVLTPPFGGATLDAEDDRIAEQWLRTGDYQQSQPIDQYRRDFSEFVGATDAFPFMSGRESFSAILKALDLLEGDEVVVPAYTCVVVPNAVAFAGLKVIYCDVELDSFSLDIDALRQVITPRTRAIVLQHLFGLVARDYAEVAALANDRNIMLIEDCAQSTGARLPNGLPAGTLGQAAFFSSEKSKVFNTGQGGVAIAHDSSLRARLRRVYEQSPFPEEHLVRRLLLSQRRDWRCFAHPNRRWTQYPAMVRWGRFAVTSTTRGEERGERPAAYGRRMPAPLAALGCKQIAKLPEVNQQRRRAAAQWATWCRQRGYAPAHVVVNSEPAFLRYPLMVEPSLKQDPRPLEDELRVRVGLWFMSTTHPVHRDIGAFPQAEEAVSRMINLPTLGL